MSLRGKYVCWGNEEGGFCFARIVGEGIVGSGKSEREVLIVEDRLSRTSEGNISSHPNKTTLRKSVIDLQKDIFDRKQGMDSLTNEQLFLLALAGKIEEGEVVHRGVMNMLQAEFGKRLEELARDTLKYRMEPEE